MNLPTADFQRFIAVIKSEIAREYYIRILPCIIITCHSPYFREIYISADMFTFVPSSLNFSLGLEQKTNERRSNETGLYKFKSFEQITLNEALVLI